MNTRDKEKYYEKIAEVFNARAEYSRKKYIDRAEKESDFEAAFRRKKSIVVKGNSGCGKTWLTKHVLEKRNKKYELINLAQAQSNGGLFAYLKSNIGKIEKRLTESLDAHAGLGPLSGGGIVENVYDISKDYYMEFLLRNNGKYIVFDNVEAITSNDRIIEELGCILTLTDDGKVQERRTQIILIGTNSDLVSIFSRLPNYETISNRLYELGEIRGFSESECIEYVIKGMRNAGIILKNDDEFGQYIFENTSGVPQNVSDLCQFISEVHIENDTMEINIRDVDSKKYINEAERRWAKSSFSGECAKISSLYNENIHNDERNNYILFGIAWCEKREITAELVQSKISEIFQEKVDNIGIRIITRYLKKISDESINSNLLEEKAKNKYRMKSRKTLMCLKAILKNEDGFVIINENAD